MRSTSLGGHPRPSIRDLDDHARARSRRAQDLDARDQAASTWRHSPAGSRECAASAMKSNRATSISSGSDTATARSPSAPVRALQGRADQLVHRVDGGDEVHRTGLEAREVEQVADQRIEPVGFVLDDARGTSTGRCAPISCASALIVVSGVRRSCDTAMSNALRSDSSRRSRLGALRSRFQTHAFDAECRIVRERIEQARTVGVEGTSGRRTPRAARPPTCARTSSVRAIATSSSPTIGIAGSSRVVPSGRTAATRTRSPNHAVAGSAAAVSSRAARRDRRPLQCATGVPPIQLDQPAPRASSESPRRSPAARRRRSAPPASPRPSVASRSTSRARASACRRATAQRYSSCAATTPVIRNVTRTSQSSGIGDDERVVRRQEQIVERQERPPATKGPVAHPPPHSLPARRADTPAPRAPCPAGPRTASSSRVAPTSTAAHSTH